MAATNPTEAIEEVEQSKARVYKVDEGIQFKKNIRFSAENSCNTALRNILKVVTVEF